MVWFIYGEGMSKHRTKLMDCPDSKVHGAYMGPTWVLSVPDGPHVGPMNLAIRVVFIIVMYEIRKKITPKEFCWFCCALVQVLRPIFSGLLHRAISTGEIIGSMMVPVLAIPGNKDKGVACVSESESEIVYSIDIHRIHLQIKLHNTITHTHM